KRKLSEAKKGHSYNKGRIVSKETREKIRKSLLGNTWSESRLRKQSSIGEKEVFEIRKLRASGLTQRAICEQLNLSRKIVSNVCTGNSYKWVDPSYVPEIFVAKSAHSRKPRSSMRNQVE